MLRVDSRGITTHNQHDGDKRDNERILIGRMKGKRTGTMRGIMFIMLGIFIGMVVGETIEGTIIVGQ